MITPKESPGRAILERIAEDYRRRGYDVVLEPRGASLPDFISDATPDIIAHRGDEHLIIEVKGSPHQGDRGQLHAIARRVAEQPGWRFVLMATGPQPDTTPDSELNLLDEQSIRRRFDEANSLVERGHLEAAFMLAWASIEALLRLLLVRDGLAPPRADPASLLRTAASEGLIGREEFARLNDAYRLRSAFVHGFRPSPGDYSREAVAATKALSTISESLLAELRKSG
jgi:HEPN domain-containing protein